MILKNFLFDNGTILLQAEVPDWKAAVRKGVDLLLSCGSVEERYYEGIIKITEEYGPYYVIGPGIAMPHARPESGALKLGFSLVTLKNPVRFGHQTNDPVDILLCLSAANKEQLNKEAIVSVMNLFDGEENIEQLRNARTHDDLLNLFNLIES